MRDRVHAGAITLLTAVLAASSLWAQYPGQVTKDAKDAPELRAVAVLEWTGEVGKPKTCRLVPVTVLDGGELQDGGIYLARPEPMALAPEVEYVLQQDGQPIGLFDIQNSGREQGSWVGYGKWKPMPAEKAKPSKEDLAKVGNDDAESDEPVLHRKKHPEDAPGGSAKPDSGSDSGSGSPPADHDPDRPVLHKKSSDDQNAGGSAPSDDPDRPVLKKNNKQKPPDDTAHVDPLPEITDTDRPRLVRGKSNDDNLQVLPTLMGLPPDMQQAVAVSDAKTRPPHPWDFSWADPADEIKMKQAMEDVARDALGLKPPATPATKKTASRKSVKPAPAEPAPVPPLSEEKFRVFELAYGSGATMVLSAQTGGSAAQRKYVTLIAQPDLYGNLLVLLKNVTDGASLDDTPRMRLVDAVDALADNRGELLFELRGNTLRQFALYRVLRGQVEKLFVSGGESIGQLASQ